ncbi:MAG: formyltetrahydrofolate deformylase [Phycisphaeraceae bacterium]|nr:formyltetrahydrofolate deformylase [Phycisphaeraceae bacterium]
MSSIHAVISVVGKDQKGVVARFATFLADRGINIEDIQQQVVHGHFMMDMLVDVSDLTVTLDELITGLLELGQSIGMRARITLHGRRQPRKIAVLVSKEPHCLQTLIEARDAGRFESRGRIELVLSNHPDLESIAAEADIPFVWKSSADKPAHMTWLKQTMVERGIDLVLLARYMQILTPDVVQAFAHRIINIHPSLLPFFPGAKPYHQAWESGVRVTGCTAHFVTEALDEGPIILQDVFHIEVGRDTAENVRRKGLELEARVLLDAARMFLDDKLVVVDDKVVFRPGFAAFLNKKEES